MDDKQKLWDSTAESYDKIYEASVFLRNIAIKVAYLHPDMAVDLRYTAKEIDDACAVIQGNRAEELNLDLKVMRKSSGELLTALLDR